MEARLAGDIYNDQAVKDIFLKGIDSHSMYAKIFFKQQLEGVDVNDVKDKFPDLRQKAKGNYKKLFVPLPLVRVVCKFLDIVEG